MQGFIFRSCDVSEKRRKNTCALKKINIVMSPMTTWGSGLSVAVKCRASIRKRSNCQSCDSAYTNTWSSSPSNGALFFLKEYVAGSEPPHLLFVVPELCRNQSVDALTSYRLVRNSAFMSKAIFPCLSTPQIPVRWLCLSEEIMDDYYYPLAANWRRAMSWWYIT